MLPTTRNLESAKAIIKDPDLELSNKELFDTIVNSIQYEFAVWRYNKAKARLKLLASKLDENVVVFTMRKAMKDL